jgi:predicted amidophosphoribosyltransferase
VDDVVTTGSTIEACGAALLQIPGLKISVATVACSI